ncbi:GNAT family N-acetyltransferase [Cellulosilyticum sp. I15G10I2]|uniref:GNAT family N-acetyltransferase n=1 Tax=Cellulosilyticum sp. I15G10I2 TaxID=1892843 RepID=UPI00085C0734|nr:GNAT family N-acetyltransferase [Cellulosilyticum sp. I15G10I2]
MSADYNIRFIRYDELRALLDLYKHFDNSDPELEDNEELKKLWDSIYNNPNLYYIVVEKEGILIATCNITIIKNLTRCARPYGLIENVVTHKKYRNKGFGKQVIKKAVEVAMNNNCYKVMVLTSSKKDETLNFYRSSGFRDDIKTGFIMKL